MNTIQRRLIMKTFDGSKDIWLGKQVNVSPCLTFISLLGGCLTNCPLTNRSLTKVLESCPATFSLPGAHATGKLCPTVGRSKLTIDLRLCSLHRPLPHQLHCYED